MSKKKSAGDMVIFKMVNQPPSPFPPYFWIRANDTWYQVSFIYDGKTTKVYVNGKLQLKDKIDNNLSVILCDEIDVQYYDYALSPEEIAQKYEDGK